jgi:hypothetical protein
MISTPQRKLLFIALLGLCTSLSRAQAQEARDFSKPLEGDMKILLALNRLTFGAGPGDFERVQ